MTVKVSDFVLQRLREWEVEHVFAYAGDGINGLLAAWGKAGNDPMFVQARHEEMAAWFHAIPHDLNAGRTGTGRLTRGRLQQRVDARDVLFLDPTRDGEPSAVLRRVAIPAGSPLCCFSRVLMSAPVSMQTSAVQPA